MNPAPLLEVTDLAKHFPAGGGFLSRPTGWVKAVNGVSFMVDRGESLGLVGESGCGKSTLARLVIRLLRPTAGTIRFSDRDIGGLDRRQMRPLRKRMQLIFQDPYARPGSAHDRGGQRHRTAAERSQAAQRQAAVIGDRDAGGRGPGRRRSGSLPPTNSPGASASASASPGRCP